VDALFQRLQNMKRNAVFVEAVDGIHGLAAFHEQLPVVRDAQEDAHALQHCQQRPRQLRHAHQFLNATPHI
jgi:hypothetical protein